jgi:hypothetical protein
LLPWELRAEVVVFVRVRDVERGVVDALVVVGAFPGGIDEVVVVG